MELKGLLEEIVDSLPILRSELALMAGSIVLLMVGLIKTEIWISRVLTAGTIIIAILLAQPEYGIYFSDSIIRDEMSSFLSVILMISTMGILVFKTQKQHNPEFYFLIIAVLVGSLFMVSVNHFLLLYIAIELTSFGSYLLSGFRFTKHASEASFKYLLFGGMSSAIMLYGISLLYGANGSLVIHEIMLTPASEFGMFLILAGMLFKTSVFPFHLWTPNTYQITPTDAVAFLSIVPKLAGFGLIFHLSGYIGGRLNDLLLILAIISVVWGTVVALPQKDVKRMVSYGAIAHSGFLLPLCLIPNAGGLAAFGYYAMIYAFMNLGFFLFVQLHEKRGNIRLMDLSGLGNRFPWMGVSAVVLVIALVGLPPTAGFNAKLYLFSAAWDTYQMLESKLWLIFIVLGVLSSAISLYFYLRVPFYYFFKTDRQYLFEFGRPHVLALTFFTIVLVLLFVRPDILDNFASTLIP